MNDLHNGISGPASEQRGNTLKQVENLYLEAQARIWPEGERRRGRESARERERERGSESEREGEGERV